MTLVDFKDIAAIIGAIAALIGTIGTLIAAYFAYQVYKNNSNLERAEWLASVYEKFYEKDDLKEIREILDCDDEISLEITKLIRDESAKFTDYLNFFEFVAFLKKENQLKLSEVDALFGYYLDCLNRRGDIRQYILKRGYELLDELLKEFSEKQ